MFRIVLIKWKFGDSISTFGNAMSGLKDNLSLKMNSLAAKASETAKANAVEQPTCSGTEQPNSVKQQARRSGRFAAKK